MTKTKRNLREANRASRKAVRIAKYAEYEDPDAKLDSREGIKMVYKLAKTVTVLSDIIQRWLTYVEGLLNTENTRKQIESGLATDGPIDIQIIQ